MAALSQNEVAERLGISYDMLCRLISYGIMAPTVRVDWGKRHSLHFSEEDFRRAAKALAELKFLAIVTPDSWRRLTDDGLRYTLLSQRYGRIAETLRPGHRIAFYVTGASAFCGIAEVTGQVQRRRTLWPQGAFPFWVPLTPKHILKPREGVKAKWLLEELDFISNKAAWEQYFRTTMRIVPEHDFSLIEASLGAANGVFAIGADR